MRKSKSKNIKTESIKAKGITKTKKTIAKESLSFTYAPAPESKAIATIPPRTELFIGGKFIAPSSGKYFNNYNPADASKLNEVAEASSKDVQKAVVAARKAYDTVWRKMSGKERGRYLFRIARILQERAREFAVLETIDGGKPIKESRDFDIPTAAQHFFYYAGWADKLEYAIPGAATIEPVGVAGQIIPWNFPLLMAAWKIAPALACGNTVVLKPAETTPLTALLLAEVCQQAELPEGVVNIITGASETGAALVNHSDVNKIAFTGSTDVGKRIAKDIAGSGKKLTLELGGKSAQIVFEDAAIDQAVEGAVNGIFFNQGHVCCAGSRLLIEESVAPVFLRKLEKRMNTLRVGDPLDKNTDIGAINSAEQLKRIEDLVRIGKKEGARFYAPENTKLPRKGYYHKPCYFESSLASTVMRVEIFGPVLAIDTFRTADEAIKKANDTPYGLAAGVWSEKGSKIHYTAGKLKAGVVWTNTYNRFDAASPFGGYRESGFGREGGRQGLYPYLQGNQ